MATSASFTLRLAITETDGASTVSTNNKNGTLSSSSTPATTKSYFAERTLSGSSETLDLTALPDGKDLTTLKVQVFMIEANEANNAAGLEFAQGAANPYFLFGTAGDKVTLFPGDVRMFWSNDKMPAVAAGAKDILISGTAADAYHIQLAAG